MGRKSDGKVRGGGEEGGCIGDLKLGETELKKQEAREVGSHVVYVLGWERKMCGSLSTERLKQNAVRNTAELI